MHIHTCQDILNIVLLTSVEDTLMGAAVGAEGWDQHGGSLIVHPPLTPFPKPHMYLLVGSCSTRSRHSAPAPSGPSHPHGTGTL